jgi:hypothetical protein
VYQIETEDDESTRITCRSLDDVSALLRDYPGLRVFDDEVQEGRALLAEPAKLGHAEFEVIFNNHKALLIFTHRQYDGHNQDKRGRE